MNTSTAFKSTATMVKKGALASAIAAATLAGNSAFADGLACARVAGNEADVEIAKAQEDWSEIFTSEAKLAYSKTECFIDQHLAENDADEKWSEIKEGFQAGMADLQEDFQYQVDQAKDAYEEAKEAAETDQALAEAKETYDQAMEEISDAYKSSVAALKEELGINES